MKKRMIKSDDYKGEDRRKDDIMRVKDFITPTTVFSIALFLVAIGGYKFVVMATADQVKCQANLIASLEDKTTATNNEVIRINTNQVEVIKKVDKILDNQNIMVRTLARVETKLEIR